MSTHTIPQAIALAEARAKAGKTAEAEAIYRQILQLNPSCAEALHGLGMIALDARQYAAAAEFIGKAIAARPGVAPFHVHHGMALTGLRALEPAVATLTKATTLRPDFWLAHHHLGNALLDQGKWQEAANAFQIAGALRPDSTASYYNQAIALKELNKLAEAESACRRALLLEPNDAKAVALLGLILRKARRYAESVTAAERALQLKPDWPAELNNLGNALMDQGSIDQAIAAFGRALELQPDLAEAHNNLGSALRKAGELDKAEAAYNRALEMRPGWLEAQNHLANVASERGRFEEAAETHRRILAAHPDFAPAHWDLSLILLRQDDYARGWEEYEWRWRVADLRLAPPLKSPRWGGEELNGKTIVLYTEQGLGDDIQFVRFVPQVIERGGRVILVSRRELVPLLKRLPGVAAVLPNDEPAPRHDVHCPMMSLAKLLGITLENLPNRVPYLTADEAVVEHWRKRFAADDRRKVGIVWAGLAHPDPLRSVAAEKLQALGEVGGVSWISLQTGEAASAVLPENFKPIDCSRELINLHETAALIEGLDLIITVDTAAAHLAGALGKPTWVLLKHVADWRWMSDRADSPWYPSMRLFRQPAPGDWDTPIRQIADALQSK